MILAFVLAFLGCTDVLIVEELETCDTSPTIGEIELALFIERLEIAVVTCAPDDFVYEESAKLARVDPLASIGYGGSSSPCDWEISTAAKEACERNAPQEINRPWLTNQ